MTHSFLTLACLLALCASGAAQIPDVAPAQVDVLDLSLEDAVAAFFANNLSVAGAELDAEASFARYGVSWGAFDTVFFVNTLRNERISAPSPANIVGGTDLGRQPATENDFWNFNTGLTGQFTSGTTWSLTAGPQWSRVQGGSIGPDFNDVDNDGDTTELIETSFESTVNTGSATLSVTHPFLRGGANGFARSALELAAKDVRLAEVELDTVAYTTLLEVITQYWNLVFALDDRATKELSVTLAEELLGITQRKFDQGLQNRIDVIEVEAEVARREEELLTADNSVLDAVDTLRKLVFAPEELEDWQQPIQPVSDYETVEQASLDEAAALAVALQERPDLKSARLALQRAEIELRRAKTGALPRLDATASYGINSNEDTVGLALGRLDDTTYHDASLRLDFEVPLVNRSGGFTERQRRIERDRAGVNLRQTEVDAIADLRSAVRAVKLQRARVEATAEEARLRGEAYEGEQRRLENDLSTPFAVRESQRDYLLALDTQTRAKLDLAVARTRLLAAQGTLLSSFGYQSRRTELDLYSAPDL
ncbi:MAG: hypothetical protein DHS20C15_02050 [Planctomycetota bacterium]|nr:MAG: hypothetical protein DHS20C15_02050 [Planctomycetota bacterium]